VPLLAAVGTAAVLAAVSTGPGRAVVDALREHVGVQRSAPALFSLPAPGRVLVDSVRGSWVVQADGSKRLLDGYHDASWSPHGLFVAAVRGRELVALEPTGDVHWTLARPRGIRAPRWSPDGYRIAYLSGGMLRVVNGDGTGDRLLAAGAGSAAPAWRPTVGHIVAFAVPDGHVNVWDADARTRLASLPARATARQLAWSAGGNRLLVRTDEAIDVYDLSGARRLRVRGLFGAAAFAPGGGLLAVVQRTDRRSELLVYDTEHPRTHAQRVFAAGGELRDVAWSPNGRWLLVGWSDADQWVFVRSTGVHRIAAAASIRAQFASGTRTFPRIGGWCC
jgi:WD40 repeat protein